MSEPAAFVHVDIDGTAHRVGRLWTASSHARESATFEYDESWLGFGGRFALEPALQLTAGPFHTRAGQRIFGALGDSAPDRWGRTLIARAERRRARAAKDAPRALRELDYLLAVSDDARQGAIRFTRVDGGPYVAEASGAEGIPPLVTLPKLLAAADHVQTDDETAAELRLLLAPGGSLGGARPKASIRDPAGALHIAKFPAAHDAYDVVAWEAVALALAERASIDVPASRLQRVSRRNVLIVARFDRAPGTRIPFLSALSALGASDGETRSYLEIADALRQFGSQTKRDLQELWKRMVFNVLISNIDDHLRNHGFLYEGETGWKLAPAYDLNPVPTDMAPRVHSTTISDAYDPDASLELALDVAKHFGVSAATARTLTAQVYASVRQWRKTAAGFGIRKSEIEQMATAFEHEDATLAASISRS